MWMPLSDAGGVVVGGVWMPLTQEEWRTCIDTGRAEVSDTGGVDVFDA